MQQMRPFNPYIEDIDMYLEEAKERGLIIPNQDSLIAYADKVNEQNQAIINRDKKSIEENRLKKKLDEDRKIEEEKKREEEKRQKKLDYNQYLREFDGKYKKGQYDPFYNKPKPSPHTGWEPRIWSTGGVEVRPNFEKNNFEISSFDIVVDSVSKSSFPSSFPKLNTTWRDDSKSNNITSVKFDITDPYFASLAASYNTFCTTGFSLQHLNSDDIFEKSISNYFVYYWMSVFLRTPKPIPEDVKKYLKENHPIKKVWTKEFHQGMETPHYWIVRQPGWKTHTIRNARPVFAKERRFGQVGISYEKVTYIGPGGKEDWKDLIPKTSVGLTKTGEKMFQQALESLVFSILDAQAKTGWSITEQGAKSYQTQDVFRKLVQDTNMKRAIVDTGVSLNFAIVPKTILIPSDMRLQTKIPGFNNILTLVRGNMHFGKNNDINVRESNPVKDKHESENEKQKPENEKYSEKHYESYYRDNRSKKESDGVKVEVIGGVVAGLFLRFLMWLI